MEGKVWLIAALAGVSLQALGYAQDKVAEGEYQIRWVENGTSREKTDSHWVLTSTSSGGYHLQSEIQNRDDGLRVIQSEELDEQMVPTAIAYDFYQKADKKLVGVIRCAFSRGSIICSGRDEGTEVPASDPFQCRGPFWLWFAPTTDVDLTWLLGGAVNMAHLSKGRVSITTVTVVGGAKDGGWDFQAADQTPLEFVGVETKEVGGTPIATRHFILWDLNSPTHLWIAGSGLVVQISGGEQGDFVLVGYKQYKKLIPELAATAKAGF